MWMTNKEKKEKLKGLEMAIILGRKFIVSQNTGVTKS